MELFIPDLKKADGRYLEYQGLIDGDPLMEISMQAAYAHKRVLIRGNWQADLRGECARCLRETSYTLSETFSEELIHLQPGETENAGDSDENLFFKGDRLNLDAYFRNYLILAQPLRILCSEECKGLCPICGQDKNISSCSCEEKTVDERWNALKAMQNA